MSTKPPTDFVATCQRLTAAVADRTTSLATLQARCREAMQGAEGRSEGELDAGGAVLLGGLVAADFMGAGALAITLGAFVENGLAPTRVVKPLIGACRRALVHAAPFASAAIAASDADAADTAEQAGEEMLHGGTFSIPMTVAQQIVAKLGAPAAEAYDSLGNVCLPVIACLTRDATLRAEARADTSFALDAEPLRGEGAKWLYDLLVGVADEEWVVLHATARRGYLVRATEINDNWCIGPLLANALVEGTSLFGRIGLPIHRPPASVVDCLRGHGAQSSSLIGQGQWEAYTWRAIDPSGALKPSTLENKIWNEGIPEDIPLLDGTRVIVLGPEIVKRTWRCSRSFGALGSDIRPVRALKPAEVDAWIMRCARGEAH